MKLEKLFAVGGPAGIMRLKVFALRSGAFGTSAGKFELKEGENEVDLRVAGDPDGWFAVEIVEVPPGNAALVLDTQRNYGRTRINGEPAPGELVARFSPVL